MWAESSEIDPWVISAVLSPPLLPDVTWNLMDSMGRDWGLTVLLGASGRVLYARSKSSQE